MADSPDKPDNPLWTGVAVLALVLAIVGIFIWPFLFEPIAGILLLIAAKQSSDPRLTRPGIVLIMICTIAGASIAASSGSALY